MTCYEHTTSLPTASGTFSTATLFIPGGEGRQLLVRANTATTLFRVQLIDENSITRRNWGFHRGELNDTSDNIRMAFVGSYTIQITNASPDDTFRVILSVRE